ncbi:MAG: DUF1345 domain-containing protein [Burkholderiaceae bacterium]
MAVAIVAGTGIALALPSTWNFADRILTGWNITVWFYLCVTGWLMMHAGHAEVRKLAEQEDESAGVVLAIMSLASVASLVAIVMELSTVKDWSGGLRLLHYAFTGATVLGSWFLLGVLFTHHYARQFYRSPPNQRSLHFPDEEQKPNYWDFLYFSFTIAVAAQTSDVLVMSRLVRRSTIIQSVLSFWFNVAIVGLSINIAASLIGS